MTAFYAKGTLHDQLFGQLGPGERVPRLADWRLRLRIADGIAEGLAYLHAQRPPILHRDLKARANTLRLRPFSFLFPGVKNDALVSTNKISRRCVLSDPGRRPVLLLIRFTF